MLFLHCPILMCKSGDGDDADEGLHLEMESFGLEGKAGKQLEEEDLLRRSSFATEVTSDCSWRSGFVAGWKKSTVEKNF